MMKPRCTKWLAANASPMARLRRSRSVRQPPGHSLARDEALQATMKNGKAQRAVIAVPVQLANELAAVGVLDLRHVGAAVERRTDDLGRDVAVVVEHG